MRLHKSRAALAAGAALTMGLSFGLSGVAQADSAARPGDVVGVGSDTLQNVADFIFDSAPGNTGGYNELQNKNRVFNDFATGDANGRAVYDGTCGAAGTDGIGTLCAATTNQTPNLLPGSIILRDGQNPVTRPNGSGAGVGALISDAPSGAGYDSLPTGTIQFARMSRLPNSTEEGNCTAASACGGLYVYQVATDQLQIAAQSAAFGGTNAPAGLTIDDLYHIFVQCDYTTWNQIPGNSGGSTDTIHPLIPQSGSGTRNFFMADIQAAEGLASTPNPGACTRTVEEHDPTGIYQDSTPKDAIEPFSAGKIALINGTATGLSAGYFLHGAGYSGTVNGHAAPNGAYTPGYLTTLLGTPTDPPTTQFPNPVAYNSTRGVYFTIRGADLAGTAASTPFLSGGTQTWAQTFFVGGTIANPGATTAVPPFIKTGTAQNLIKEAGFTPAYVACAGNPNPTTC